ncbi:hypothetical protein M407DRAFT_111161 [Tulasnella calospora MUT 4182]|uniref:Uncharacterized protein n=1 Tax=Tulasnella calospora MUT 4182 TaxID=1051891 RepID=A0A0C3QE39_9AGAM|nr:hypothetical protein M407DRAFT_111161 [Tulasnella calospora MUT 4182]
MLRFLGTVKSSPYSKQFDDSKNWIEFIHSGIADKRRCTAPSLKRHRGPCGTRYEDDLPEQRHGCTSKMKVGCSRS